MNACVETAPLSNHGKNTPIASKHRRRLLRSPSSHMLRMDSSFYVDQVNPKICKPHYSHLHGGIFELLSVDDDPVNQVLVRCLLFFHQEKQEFDQLF